MIFFSLIHYQPVMWHYVWAEIYIKIRAGSGNICNSTYNIQHHHFWTIFNLSDNTTCVLAKNKCFRKYRNDPTLSHLHTTDIKGWQNGGIAWKRQGLKNQARQLHITRHESSSGRTQTRGTQACTAAVAKHGDNKKNEDISPVCK